jgi:hypothetical protein
MNEPEFDEMPATLPVLAQRPTRAALPRLAAVLAGGVLLGFVLGLAAAPQGNPTATLPPVAVAPAVVAVSPPAPSITPQPSLGATLGVPPADALALPAALTAFGRNNGVGVLSRDVISARLTTVASAEAASSSLAAPPDEWVWAFVVRGSFPPVSCGGYTATPHACPSPATRMLILLDARTGEFVLATSPVRP